ncbi:zinc finger protein 324A [Mugil cephalus]|uniref:zinc finger protein 324A n=1 Tax=Mugil cephalus TaxID=48193 RepID=UPI001FB6EEE4|nr:zinc finger protein 324A [Mugil cephalus]
MESCSFQSQLLSVMEVLAKAAVEEINRRVEDSCAVLRLDIELLKSKCEGMEAELRRSRMRARRKGFNASASERFSPLVKVVLNRRSLDWDSQVEAEARNQSQQCADMEPETEAEDVRIKVERADEDTWRDDPEDRLTPGAEQLSCFKASQPAQIDGFAHENPADSRPPLSPADAYDDSFPGGRVNGGRNETELLVKREKEEEPDENAAPLGASDTPVTEDRLWSSSLRGDAGDLSVSYPGQQFEPAATAFAPQSGLRVEDVVSRGHPLGKSVAVSAARAKRRARTFGPRRPQPDEGHGALSQINSLDSSPVPQQPQLQHRDAAAPHARAPGEDPGAANRGFVLARRMRTPWRPGLGEKRFSCTYCSKGFVRFSQLKEHLRSHTGEKPFSCMQCGRSFTKQCNLIRHAVVHSGEKPFECSVCGKCFTQRSSLKSHQKTVH